MLPSAPDCSSRATRALGKAVEQGKLKDAERAIANCADANALVSFQFAPQEPHVQVPVLFLALARSATDLVDRLIQARASLDARVLLPGQVGAGQGRTVLDVVKREEDLLALLAAGMLWHQANGTKERDMVLHVAAERGWHDVITWLGRRGAEIDVRNALGQTPLHAAVRSAAPLGNRWRRQKTIHELVAGGARMDVVDANGQTLLQTALLHCPEMVPALIHEGVILPGERTCHPSLWRDLPLGLRTRIEVALTLREHRQMRLRKKEMAEIGLLA